MCDETVDAFIHTHTRSHTLTIQSLRTTRSSSSSAWSLARPLLLFVSLFLLLCLVFPPSLSLSANAPPSPVSLLPLSFLSSLSFYLLISPPINTLISVRRPPFTRSRCLSPPSLPLCLPRSPSSSSLLLPLMFPSRSYFNSLHAARREREGEGHKERVGMEVVTVSPLGRQRRCESENLPYIMNGGKWTKTRIAFLDFMLRKASMCRFHISSSVSLCVNITFHSLRKVKVYK